jgi:hypothetical protein
MGILRFDVKNKRKAVIREVSAEMPRIIERDLDMILT